MSSIFKVSGADGSIIWQLGGAKSSFNMDDAAHFVYQHDARVLASNGDTTVISMLNNFAAPSGAGKNFSAAQIVSLNTSDMTATRLQEIRRPDGFTTAFRGNFQMLPNSNRFIGWSSNGFISEHTPDGRLAFQARFKSRRFVSYRAYKFDWSAVPCEEPALAVVAYGEAVTVAYVSWNGATEVDTWRFYATDGSGDFQIACDVRRESFETECAINSPAAEVFAQALSRSGGVLATTSTVKSQNGLNGDGVIKSCESCGSNQSNQRRVGHWNLADRSTFQAGNEHHVAPSMVSVLLIGFAVGYIFAKRR